MFRQIWQKSYKSVCSIHFYTSEHIEVIGVTGFKVSNKILTEDTIYSAKDAVEVNIRFYMEDGIAVSASKSLSYKDFLAIIPPKEDFGHLGFAVIPHEFEEFDGIDNLQLYRSCSTQIGQSVSVIGYQSEHKNLALKSGFISSFHVNDKGLGYIQYDGTIKPGNSGAPLIDSECGNVLGIVMNRELPVAKSYRELNRIIDSNLQVLKEFEGRYNLYEIDPIQVLMASQNQIRHISKEFFMNATVKMGLALEIEHVAEYVDGGGAIDQERDQCSDSGNQ
jgi:hypothetical protein